MLLIENLINTIAICMGCITTFEAVWLDHIDGWHYLINTAAAFLVLVATTSAIVGNTIGWTIVPKMLVVICTHVSGFFHICAALYYGKAWGVQAFNTNASLFYHAVTGVSLSITPCVTFVFQYLLLARQRQYFNEMNRHQISNLHMSIIPSKETEQQVGYLAVVIVVYLCLGATLISLLEGWQIETGIYYCVSLMSTIGFGDVHVSNPITLWIVIVYMLIGILLFGMLIFSIRQVVLEITTRKLSYRLFQLIQTLVNAEELGIATQTPTEVVDLMQLEYSAESLTQPIGRSRCNSVDAAFSFLPSHFTPSPSLVYSPTMPSIQEDPAQTTASIRHSGSVHYPLEAFRLQLHNHLFDMILVFLFLTTALIIIFALCIQYLEKWEFQKSLYFVFMVVTSVGDGRGGEGVPKTRCGRNLMLFGIGWMVIFGTVTGSLIGEYCINEWKYYHERHE